MKISVIIPSYNPNIDKLILCLKAIHSSNYKPFEIILVDDGSTKDYTNKIKHYCRIIKNKRNMGPAYSRNIGTKKAKGKILCFIDSDVKIYSTTLNEIADKLNNPDIAAIQTVYSKFTPIQNFTSQYMNLYQHYNFKIIKLKYLNSLASHCIAVRKAIFLEVGGFDEGIKKASIEDEHLGIALFSRGYKILLAKDINVDHLEYYNLTKLLKRMFIMGKNKIRCLCSNPKTRKMNLSRTHHPLNLIVSILISPLILTLFLIMVWPLTQILFVLVVLIFCIININFFIFLLKNKGTPFMFQSIVIYYLASLSIFFGAVKGGIDYLTK